MLIEAEVHHRSSRPAAARTRPIAAGPAHVAAAGLAGSALADRFCFWRGRSGRRYVFSVYRMGSEAENEATPRYADAVVLAVRRDAEGVRTIVAQADSGPFPELSPVTAEAGFDLPKATELHVHLLAGNRAARRAVLDDLADAVQRFGRLDRSQPHCPVRA